MTVTQTLKAFALAALLLGCSSEDDADEDLTGSAAATTPAVVEPEDPAVINAPLLLKIVSPASAKKGGDGFYKQPDGTVALGVTSENASRATSIFINGEKLPTTYGNPTFLSAIVPSSVVDKAGAYEIHLSDGKRTSNKMQLTVE